MELRNEDFHNEIKNGLVLVDFYATWCGPCKMMHPVIEKVEQEYSDVKVIQVDVDQHEDLAREYSVMSIPTLCLMKNGKLVEKNIGFTPKEQLDQWISDQREK